MKLRVVRSLRAAVEIDEIALYLSEHNPAAANRFRDALAEAYRQLAEFPNSGQRGITGGSRRLVVGNYILHYRRRDDAVEIFAVRHARRRDAREPR